jgi:hypothetical protein
VDFIDKQDIVAFQVSQDSCEVAGAFDCRAGGGLDIDANLSCDNVRKAGLPKAGRAVKKGMVEWLTALTGGGDRNNQVFPDLVLTDEIGQRMRSEAGFQR